MALIIGFALWGLFVGLVVGFTAIGKGLIGTPGLIVFFGIPPVTAVGSMAVAGFAMMLSGTLRHYKSGNVILPVALLFSVSALPASYIAATYASSLNEVFPLETVIGVVIIVSAALLFYRYVIVKASPRELSVNRQTLTLSPVLGLFLGALMGATSISGSIIVIAFIMLLRLPSPNAVGTTSLVSAASLLVASVAHVQSGNIDWSVVAAMVPGVLVGAAIGATYMDRVPRQALRMGILVLLLAAGLMVLLG